MLSNKIWPQQQHSTSLWSSINFRAIYSPAFIKPLIFYQFQIIIQPSIHQASDILSISEHYPDQHSTILWSSINFREKYIPEFIKPLIFYQFQSIIQFSIKQAYYLLSISEQYIQNVYTLLWQTPTRFYPFYSKHEAIDPPYNQISEQKTLDWFLIHLTD